MLLLLKAIIVITVILGTILESYEGKTDNQVYQVAAKRHHNFLSKHARSLQHFTNYYSGPGVPLEKRQNCFRSSDCPVWFFCNNNTQSTLRECQCGPRYKNAAIVCNETTMMSAVVEYYCITEVDGTTYAGYCFYNHRYTLAMKDSIYEIISDKKDINEFMCGRFNRTGILCGKCKPGLSSFVLSYNLSCVECPDSHKNWWKFAMTGFVPLTFLYFIAIFFNVNITSSRLHGYVLFSQAISTPAYVRTLFVTTEDIPWVIHAAKALEPFFSPWNLDPFRSILPDTCLNVNTLTALALEACVAMYPLVLMIASYLLIELYDRNTWCIVCMWKPFRLVFHLLHDNWDIRTSVIDSFATFFLLSYVKILSVSIDLLLFTAVHELPANKIHYRIYYDANVELFRGSHIPYALLAVTLTTVFVIIPTLILILYPFRCFQKCLSYYQIQWHFLHAFVDSFQGCYKDGTEPDTHDLRWFSAYDLVLRLSLCIVFTLTLNALYFIYATVLILLVLIFLVNFQPHKSSVSYYTTIDITFLILLSLHYITLILGIHAILRKGQQYYIYLICVLGFFSCVIPIIYLIFITLQWMWLKRKWSGQFLTRVRAILITNNC